MPEDPSQDFGVFLRQARDRSGVSLRQIATVTKISVPALEALERNNVSQLPGGIFSRAFVRAYARQVGLDPEDAVRRFVTHFPSASSDESPPSYQANPENIVVDEEPPSGRTWRVVRWAVPVALIVVLFGFGGRLAWWPDQPPARPDGASEPAAGPAHPATPVMSTPAGEPRPAADAPGRAGGGPDHPPAPALSGSRASRLVESAAGPLAAAAAAPPVPAAEGSTGVTSGTPAPPPAPVTAPAEGGFRLTLAPRAACWVTIRVDHKVVFAATMGAGDRKDLMLQGTVSFTVGNAGAMTYAIDGQPGRALGADGAVVTAILTPRNLKTFLDVR